MAPLNSNSRSCRILIRPPCLNKKTALKLNWNCSWFKGKVEVKGEYIAIALAAYASQTRYQQRCRPTLKVIKVTGTR